MPIPWIIGGLIVAGVAAVVASGDDDSSSSTQDLDSERERVRQANQRKKKAAETQASNQRKASKNKAKAQRFITKYKLDLKPEELISANEQGNDQLSLLAMDSFNNKESVRLRNCEIEALEQDLVTLARLEAEL